MVGNIGKRNLAPITIPATMAQKHGQFGDRVASIWILCFERLRFRGLGAMVAFDGGRRAFGLPEAFSKSPARPVNRAAREVDTGWQPQAVVSSSHSLRSQPSSCAAPASRT